MLSSSPVHAGTPPPTNHSASMSKPTYDVSDRQPHVSEPADNTPGSRRAEVTTPVRHPETIPEPEDKIPHGYRPGRLSQIEILERIFPFQKRPVLELVLQGCNGDLVKAIEHFLSAQDTLVAQHQNINTTMYNATNNSTSSRPTENSHHGFHPYMAALNQLRPTMNPHNKLASVTGSMKSAFTPLPPHPSPYSSMHMALNQRTPGYSTDALLHKLPPSMHNPLFSSATTPMRTGDMLNTSSGLPHTPFGFGQFPLPLTNSSFGFPHFLSHHRPFGLDSLPHHNQDKNSDRTDSDRASDSWTESPGKDSKDSLE